MQDIPENTPQKYECYSCCGQDQSGISSEIQRKTIKIAPCYDPGINTDASIQWEQREHY